MRPAEYRPFDAVTREILWRRATSAVDKAVKALRRTRFSTLVDGSRTLACVLPAGRTEMPGSKLR